MSYCVISNGFRIEEPWLYRVICYAELISMPTSVYLTKGATVAFMETWYSMYYIPDISCRLLS